MPPPPAARPAASTPGPHVLPTLSPKRIVGPRRPVYVRDEMIRFTGGAAAALAAHPSGPQQCWAMPATVDSTLESGLDEALRTLEEAQRYIAAWSAQPRGWSDEARTERWHTAGRLEALPPPAAGRGAGRGGAAQ